MLLLVGNLVGCQLVGHLNRILEATQFDDDKNTCSTYRWGSQRKALGAITQIADMKGSAENLVAASSVWH